MVQEMVRQWLQELKEYNYSTWLSTVIAVALLMLGGWNVRKWLVVSREQKAQFAMSEAFEEYDRAILRMVESKEQDDQVVKQQLEDAHLSFDVVLRTHGSSALASCAHAFEADIYWYENKKEEALQAMDAAIKGAPKSPLIYQWKIKAALMKLDAGKEEEGISALTALAADPKNANADRAAFELGYYYWCKKDEAHARDAWKLLEKFDGSKDDEFRRTASPYLTLARMKLSAISE
jgi:hypothetical protein